MQKSTPIKKRAVIIAGTKIFLRFIDSSISQSFTKLYLNLRFAIQL